MIGFDAYSQQGPGIFLTRLQHALQKRGLFSATDPAVWIQLSFQALPEWIQRRREAGQTKVMVRMDGCYCSRAYKIRKPFLLPVPLLDDWYSAKVNRKKNRQIRENLQNADAILYQSEFSRRLTQRFVTSTPPGHIVYNGIDLTEFAPAPTASLSITPTHAAPTDATPAQANAPTPSTAPIPQENSINILVSHSFRPYHRLHDSFKILARLLQQASQTYHLHIVGSDDQRSFAYARQVADQLQLKADVHYTFHGKKPHQELAAFYRTCDFMLNLSYWDTCPNVVVEALACGLPVVGVNHGGVAELVGQHGGILVDERIPFTWIDHQNFKAMPQAPVQAYVDAIIQLSGNLSAFSESARAEALQRLNIETVCEQYIRVAETLMPLRHAQPETTR